MQGIGFVVEGFGLARLGTSGLRCLGRVDRLSKYPRLGWLTGQTLHITIHGKLGVHAERQACVDNCRLRMGEHRFMLDD